MSQYEEIKITPYDTPWDVACMIINAEYERQDIFNQTVTSKFFDIEDLMRIGEHLVNYCKTERRELT